MRHRRVTCPRCSSLHEYLLSADDDHHLRQCPDCGGWFVHHDDTDVTEFLEDPPRCPVEGCDETLPPEQLPVHVIEVHDGELAE